MDTITRRQQLLDGIGSLSTDEIETRRHELEMYFLTNIPPIWAVSKAKDFLDVDYLDERFLEHYQCMLNMECLDRCKSFTLWPVLNFKYLIKKE
jgi:hypothetical protein